MRCILDQFLLPLVSEKLLMARTPDRIQVNQNYGPREYAVKEKGKITIDEVLNHETDKKSTATDSKKLIEKGIKK
jgi:hypothetical protein